MESNILKVLNTINKVYPMIAKDYNSSAKVELYDNIFSRLDATSAINEHESYAEYHWDKNKIFIYTDYMNSEEDIIRSLIHECVHSNHVYDIHEAYYNECDLDYENHPHEIEAEYEEEKWEKYKLNTNEDG
tara:strand:+ start:612 stop:1004 length:393 start_codon:yes stop_codon:yes gene_type:complete